MNILSKTSCALALGMGMAVSAQLAYAQDAAGDQAAKPAAQLAQAAPEQVLERVEITGSHIKRADAETAENVQVVTAADIQHTGAPTVADLLHNISANFASFNETDVFSFAPGSFSLALRGLSQKNTLTLINGHRMTNYGFGQNAEDMFVDLNTIPASAIDRIEILKSGANAVYGSDATAGVVNVIFKRKTTEKSVDASASLTTEGGGDSHNVALSGGFGDFEADGYNVFVTGAYLDRSNLLASQRPYTASMLFQNYPGTYSRWSFSGYGSAAANASTPTVAIPTCGGGALGTVLSTIPPQAGIGTGPACGYNPASQQSLIPGTQRANVVTTFDVKLGSIATLYGDVFFSNNRTQISLPPQGFGGPSGALVFSKTNGLTELSTQLPSSNPSYNSSYPYIANYVFNSVPGAEDEEVVSNTYRALLGVKANMLGVDWDAAYGHSENHVTTAQHYINATVLMSEIASGSFDFNNPGSTPAANAALGVVAGNQSKTQLDTFDLQANKEVFHLPGGAAGLASGIEVRRESIANNPDANIQGGNILDVGASQATGARTVVSGFAELDMPLVKTFDADLAARWEHYSDEGNNFSPQMQLRWQPITQATLRGVASKGFRAPTLLEMSNATSFGFTGVTYNGQNEQIGLLTASNPKLRPETSKTFDLGLILSPTRLTNVSIDYYNITIDHVIAPGTSSPQTMVDNPSAYPGQIFFTPSGNVSYVLNPFQNAFELNTRGWDLEGDIRFDLGGGDSVKLAAAGTYLQSLAIGQGGAWTNFAGSNGWDLLSPIYGGGPAPYWRVNFTATWESPDWMVSGTEHYVDSYANTAAQAVGGPPSTYTVSGYATTDFYVEYRGLKHWNFSAALVNAFNRAPPFDWSSWAVTNFFPAPYEITLYDARDRYMTLHAKYTF